MSKFATSLIVMFLVPLLSVSAKAEDKVWYCEVRAMVKTDLTGHKALNPEKFKMTVNKTEVVFGPSGYFHSKRMPVRNYVRSAKFEAADHQSWLTFRQGSFQLATISADTVLAVSALCDDS